LKDEVTALKAILAHKISVILWQFEQASYTKMKRVNHEKVKELET